MRLQQLPFIFSRPSKRINISLLTLTIVLLLSSCTPYNGSIYSNGIIPNNNSSKTHTAVGNTPSVPNAPTFTQNPAATTPPSTSVHQPVEAGIQALFDCTEELGYNAAFTAHDYQNCLQITQATLTNYAFDLLKGYIMTWADFAIDTALHALGFTSGRSYASTQEKSSQLTSIIASGYRWY